MPKVQKTAYHECLSLWKNLLQAGLEEDGWQWDWTTLGTLSAAKAQGEVRARVVAKSEGIWAGAGLVSAVNALAGELSGGAIAPGAFASSPIGDGERFKHGTVVTEWKGPARLVLALERPFLNLASYVSGIATSTRVLVDIAGRACPRNTPRVTPTRKTLPGYRDIAVLGVQAGGGYSHRVSLSGGVLIKENHIAAAGSIRAAVEGARAKAPHGLKIEIEVRDERELRQAIDAGADGVLLDNFSPEEVRAALARIAKAKPRPVVEVSGGLNASNIGKYAMEGVDVLSVGSLSHSVQAVDLSLLVVGKKG